MKFSRLGDELVKVRNADLESNENPLGIMRWWEWLLIKEGTRTHHIGRDSPRHQHNICILRWHFFSSPTNSTTPAPPTRSPKQTSRRSCQNEDGVQCSFFTLPPSVCLALPQLRLTICHIRLNFLIMVGIFAFSEKVVKQLNNNHLQYTNQCNSMNLRNLYKDPTTFKRGNQF